LIDRITTAAGLSDRLEGAAKNLGCAMANPHAAPTRFAESPVIEPESQTGTLRDAADRLRLLRSPPAAPIRHLQRRWGRFACEVIHVWMLPDRVAILKCGGRLSAIWNEADKNRLDRKQVRCLQWQWLFGGQATSATRPQDLPAAMSEVSGLRKNQKSRPLRRLADSTIGKPSARTPDAGYTMCWLTGPLARQTGRKVIEL
jgi:hypothetical protein